MSEGIGWEQESSPRMLEGETASMLHASVSKCAKPSQSTERSPRQVLEGDAEIRGACPEAVEERQAREAEPAAGARPDAQITVRAASRNSERVQRELGESRVHLEKCVSE